MKLLLMTAEAAPLFALLEAPLRAARRNGVAELFSEAAPTELANG